MKRHNWKLMAGGLAAVVLVAAVAGFFVLLKRKSTAEQKVAVCELEGCFLHGLTVSRAIDQSVDSCVDVYKYTVIQVMERDDKHVTAAQTFYQSCINAAKLKEKNLKVFLDFKRDLVLLWPEKQPTDSLHPLDMMLNLAIRWDMNFLFDVGAIYSYGRPALLISRSHLGIGWKARIDDLWSEKEYRKIVRSLFELMGIRSTDVGANAEELWRRGQDPRRQASLAPGRRQSGMVRGERLRQQDAAGALGHVDGHARQSGRPVQLDTEL
ncbi:hypothetical protein HPB52_018771 [Rhipicephalus sanguineus]|uniref:Uncharacterized protein n=1 Tax=Rhipicephalus sanguineus TaxID=34632 RepID=A0A9D4PP98_RHISA|nr:hypothetical protein HPB52_018771 [Rhipicephalus sanguineus]